MSEKIERLQKKGHQKNFGGRRKKSGGAADTLATPLFS